MDKLWNVWQDGLYAEYFSMHIFKRWRRIVDTLSIIAYVGSLSAVGTWFVWREFPRLWSAIAIVCQTIGFVLPKLSISKQLTGLRLYRMEIRRLNMKVEALWDDWYYLDREATKQEIENLECEYVLLEERFLEGEPHCVSARVGEKILQEVISSLDAYRGQGNIEEPATEQPTATTT